MDCKRFQFVDDEEIDPKFQVREFLELWMLMGQRRIRIYFTDIAVYIIEYYTGFGMSYFWVAIPLRILLTPILGPMYRRTIENMTDIREIMGATTWYRRYAYEEIISIWIEKGDLRDRLYFEIERINKNISTPGFGSGTDYLTFDKEKIGEFDEVLTRRMGVAYKGIKE